MKFQVRTTLKIILYVVLLFTPILILITLYSLHGQDIPLFNIGVRNVLSHSRRFVMPSLLISYLIGTLLVISTIDKMRVTSLFALHVPPILVGVIMGMIFGLVQVRDVPLPVNSEGLRIGYATFLKRNVFIETGDYTFYLDTGGDTSALYVYSLQDSNLVVDDSIAFGEEVRLDREGNRVLFQPGAGRREGYEVPFDEFVTYEGIWTEGIFRSYARRLRSIYGQLRVRMNALDRQRSFILMGALLLSVLMIIIPLTFGLNDHGWGFSGVVGVFLVLGLLPYIYALILGGINRLSRDPQFLGGYTYLFPAAVFAMLGILLDIIVTMRRSAR